MIKKILILLLFKSFSVSSFCQELTEKDLKRLPYKINIYSKLGVGFPIGSYSKSLSIENNLTSGASVGVNGSIVGIEYVIYDKIAVGGFLSLGRFPINVDDGTVKKTKSAFRNNICNRFVQIGSEYYVVECSNFYDINKTGYFNFSSSFSYTTRLIENKLLLKTMLGFGLSENYLIIKHIELNSDFSLMTSAEISFNIKLGNYLTGIVAGSIQHSSSKYEIPYYLINETNVANNEEVIQKTQILGFLIGVGYNIR